MHERGERMGKGGAGGRWTQRLGALAARLRDEAIYAWPGWGGAATFNIGYAPVSPAVAADPAARAEALQLQLYDEVAKRAASVRSPKSGDVLVEIAAGAGGGLAWLARRGPWRVAGVDRAGAAVRRGRRRGLDLRLADAARLPFAQASVDYAVCIELVGVDDAKKAAVLAEARRVLRSDGVLVWANFELGSLAQARRQLERQAAGRFVVREFRDVTDNALQALDLDEARKRGLLARVPSVLRAAVRESMALDGTRRRAEWRRGDRCYFVAALVPVG